MSLRLKLATWFWAVLVCAILATSIASLGKALKIMAKSLIASGDFTVEETFEQIRGALSAGGARDPEAVLRADRGLRTAIDSVHAFGKYVVYVKVTSPGGRTIVAAPPEPKNSPEQAPPPEIGALKQAADSAIPLALLPALWSDRTYEVSKAMDLNGHPFGMIRVGLSTGLVAADIHRLAIAMGGIGLAAIVISTFLVMMLSNQLLRPVRALATGLERLTEGDGELALEARGGDELSTLTDQFNRLSRRVRDERTRWETERGRLVDAFRSVTDAVLLIDRGGALLFSNQEARRRLQLGTNNAGKPLGVLLGANHPLMGLIAPALAVGSEVHDVALELASDGEEPARVMVSIFPLGQGQTPAGLLVMLRDLKRVAELEAVVDYSRRLARLGGLLSGVAHQLRGPLNAMTAQLQLLYQDAESGIPAGPRIERLRHELDRLDRTIDGLMRFMRPQELKTEEIPLNDLLKQAGATVAQRNVKVEYRLAGDAGQIAGDKELLTEALRNIVQNGAQAMPEGGLLTIRSKSTDDGCVEIEIADQGAGIPPEDRERVFDLYFTTKAAGSGLGLPLALRAIDLHRGSIGVESAPGSGAVFRIRLPRGPELPAPGKRVGA